MTIGKKLSAAAAVAGVLAVLFLLSSCQKTDNSQVLEQLESLRDAQTQNNEGDGYSRYRIVVPEDCSGQIWEAAERISAHVLDKTGKDCTVVKDGEAVAELSGIREILFGYTDREASRELMAALNRDDYICTSVGAAVVLGGRSDRATLEAAERFLTENTVTESGILTVSEGFEYFCQYDFENAVLWDNCLGSMTVVCSSENAELAKLFVEAVADRCGDYPEIVCGKTETDGRRELLFTADSSVKGLSRISYDGEDVRIVSDTEYGLSVAAFGLIERLFDGDGGAAEVRGDREISFVYEVPGISVGFIKAELSDRAESQYLANVARYINNSGVDVMIINGVDGAFAAELQNITDGELAFRFVNTADGAGAVAVYKSDRFSVKTMEFLSADSCSTLNLVVEDNKSGRSYGLLDFFVENASAPTWRDTVSRSLSGSAGISFALLSAAQTSSDFCIPAGTYAAYSSKETINGGEGRLLGLVSANGNACAQVSLDSENGEALTALRADVSAVWCDGFFEIFSENNTEG